MIGGDVVLEMAVKRSAPKQDHFAIVNNLSQSFAQDPFGVCSIA
jgi:hypothetical protein